VVVLRRRVAGMSEAALARFVSRARREAGLKGAVNVLLTSSSELQSLNRRFRGKNEPTDVLSFPSDSDLAGDGAGEIAISAEIASQNARVLGHLVATEVKILTLHGILHLRGYDHEHDQGQMATLEQKLRRKLRLPLGLIERAEPSGKQARRSRTSARSKT
jgi:probable rRNA maturation factor